MLVVLIFVITEGDTEKGLSSMELSEEDLRRNMDLADKSLSRQRLGVGEKSGPGEEIGPLTGPKEGPVTMGPAWDGEVSLEPSEDKKGLVFGSGGLKYICEYEDCSENWSTGVLPKDQAAVLVKMYEMHVNQHHSKKKTSTEEEKFDRDQESYKEVIKERIIPACVDNRVDQLSPARFLAMPLQYQFIAKNQPPQQTPVYQRIDLAHLGLHMADTTVVGKMHNRCYGGSRLRDFLPINLGVDEDDKDVLLRPQRNGALKQTKSFKSINTMDEAVLALMNCNLIWRFIHPLDYGTEAIVRFLINKIHHHNSQRRLTSVTAVCAFFQSAMKGNADRVLGPENPRTYQELVSFYNSMDWSSTPVPAKEVDVEVDYGNSEGRGSNKRPGSGYAFKDKKRSRNASVPVCYAFNRPEGCPRAQGDMCIKEGKTLMHICNRVGKNGKICGSKEHGQAGHV